MNIRLDKIVKFFGSYKALDEVSITIRPGEIVGLLGENGAGKTTLMNILYGLYRPDKGSIWIDNNRFSFVTPSYAMSRGIYYIQQFPRLIESMNGIENLRILSPKDHRILLSLAEDYNSRHGLGIDLRKKVSEMTLIEKQKLYTLISLVLGAKILLLDEPNILLTTDELYRDFLRKYASEGNSVLISSHKIPAVTSVADRIYVMRRGRIIAELTGDLRNRQNEILKMLFENNERLDKKLIREIESKVSDEVRSVLKELLEIKDLFVKEDIRNVNIRVSEKEIVSILLPAGGGDKELFEILAGIKRSSRGSILFNNIDISHEPPYKRVSLGIFYIPDNRLDLVIPRYKIIEFMRLWRIKDKKAVECLNETSVFYRSLDSRISELSGGNISRLILSVMICSKPRLVVAHNIFNGLDAKGYEAAVELIKSLRELGVSFLLILNDYEEALDISDRIYVLNDRGSVEIDIERARRDPSLIWRSLVT